MVLCVYGTLLENKNLLNNMRTIALNKTNNAILEGVYFSRLSTLCFSKYISRLILSVSILMLFVSTCLFVFGGIVVYGLNSCGIALLPNMFFLKSW